MGTGEADDVVSGRSHDRQWAVLMSASGQLYGRLRAVSRGRRHAIRVSALSALTRSSTLQVETAQIDLSITTANIT